MTAVEDVFSKGKYMQKATVEQSHTKWVRYNGITPSPRPGAVSTLNTTLNYEDWTQIHGNIGVNFV